MRTKFFVITGTLVATLMLSGCQRINNYVSDYVSDASKQQILQSDEYQQYEKYKSEQILNEEGVYATPVPVETDKLKTRVTFATNSFIDCDFYKGENATEHISSAEVFLDPGESIFAKNVAIARDYANQYEFSCFRIWSYDKNGNRSTSPYKVVSAQEGLIFTAPKYTGGTGFSIEPLVSYTEKRISVEAFYLQNGKKQYLNQGQWRKNDELFTDGLKVNPAKSYTISYDYSKYKDTYYIVNTTPEYFFVDDERGYTVIFNEASSIDIPSKYSVQLHTYLSLELDSSSAILSITKNSEEQHFSTKSKKIVLQKLKVGDKISILVDKDFKLSGNNIDPLMITPRGINAKDGYEYTYEIPDSEKVLSLAVTKRNPNSAPFYGYSTKNGTVIVTRQDGTPIEADDERPGPDEKVTLIIAPRSSEYYIQGFTNSKDYSFVLKDIKFSKLEKDIDSILNEHQAIKFVLLDLVFRDKYGSYSYELDGKPIHNSPIKDARIGQKLSVVFQANDQYVIDHGGLVANLWSNVISITGTNNSFSGDILVTSKLSANLINYTTFGIKINERG